MRTTSRRQERCRSLNRTENQTACGHPTLKGGEVYIYDIQMPEMDGLEAARAIRKRWPASKQPRIVAITAYAMEGDQKMCLDAGMDDYISKPVKIDELRAALESAASL